ncbi:MAG TPA: radical SAM family heme chaperone HemW [Desulfuromonadales bacterium]|nr:radical SAM family heme chaperone HemW [Desulfuromonadales bacterium]
MKTSLYLHIPFCLSKCSYCDFFSVPVAHATDLEEYIGLLLRQLQLAAAGDRWNGPFATVFFGGGTPSLLTPEQISRILEFAEQLFGFEPDVEISLEANPGTVSPASLNGYRTAGINRLSLGVQTFSENRLRRIGRPHTATENLGALRLARQAGFDNLACDLMFALPGQRLADLHEDLQRALEFLPEHFSCYGLSAEADTPLGAAVRQGLLSLPDDEFYADAFLLLHAELEAAGYEHYEIANYARPGFACRHNLGYWLRQPSLGLGAGAHSFLTAGWGARLAAANDLQAYREQLLAGRDPMTAIEEFDRAGAMRETIYLGLRTRQGVDNERFRARFGASVEEAFPAAVRQLAGHLQYAHGRWRLQPADWLLFDHWIEPFL